MLTLCWAEQKPGKTQAIQWRNQINRKFEITRKPENIMKNLTSKFLVLLCVGLCLVALTLFVNQRIATASLIDDETSLVEAGAKPETRCGWFSNPTPANAWLDDRDGQWIIAVQGGYQAEGDWASFKANQWVKTNGNYGYGCTCMNVTTNKKSGRILTIRSATARPLSACRKDKRLKEPR